MLRRRPWRGYWTALAGALAASCILNPQPEPPGNNAGLPPTGGGYNGGVGGVYGAGGNGFHVSSGGDSSADTSTYTDPGKVRDAGDIDAGDIDAGDDSP